MPGVPSGKGCNACRKQKKKCDWRGSSCSRCRRLQISCVGAGQQRYKFMVHTHEVAIRKTRNNVNLVSDMFERMRLANNYCYPVGGIPSNQHTRLVDSFLEKLNPALGVRYHLAWTFGDYLAEVPCRLGTNPALDAAADAVVVCYSTFTNRINHRSLMLIKYNEAIHMLRLCLDDPALARSTETLCAVMLLMICQMFTGDRFAHPANHADGAATIIRMRGKFGNRDPFADKLLLTLTGPLVFQALFAESVPFSDEEWLDLFDSALSGSNPVGVAMSCLSKVSLLMRRTRKALRGDDLDELAAIAIEALALRDKIQQPLEYLKEQLDLVNEPVKNETKQPPVIMDLLICVWIRLRALGVTIAILINRVRVAATSDQRASQEMQQYGRELLDLTRSARRFRPLGASSLPLSLEVAWIILDDEDLKAEIDSIHQEFAGDFWDMPFRHKATGLPCTIFESSRGVGLLYTFDRPDLDSTWSTPPSVMAGHDETSFQQLPCG